MRVRSLPSGLVAALVLAACGGSGALPPAAGALLPRGIDSHARASDLAGLAGEWKGSLAYEDYGTGKPTRIEVEASGTVAGREASLAVRFPKEPGHERTSLYTVSPDGTTVGGLPVIERTEPSPGVVRLVLEERGKDGNDEKPATFQHEIVIAPATLRIAKKVRFDGTTNFFERSAFDLRR